MNATFSNDEVGASAYEPRVMLMIVLLAYSQARIDALRKEAARTRQFLASAPKRLNRKGQELKTNITDPVSAKMATSKGVIQGHAAQAAVDSAHQIIGKSGLQTAVDGNRGRNCGTLRA